LDRAHDDVAALEGQRLGASDDTDVVRLGAAAREDDLTRGRVQERRHLGARVLHRSLRLLAERVHAGSVPEVLPEIGKHRLEDLGADGGAGVVIQVDTGHDRRASGYAQAIKQRGRAQPRSAPKKSTTRNRLLAGLASTLGLAAARRGRGLRGVLRLLDRIVPRMSRGLARALPRALSLRRRALPRV